MPWHIYNVEACDTAKQTLLGLDGLMDMVELKKDGPLPEKVRELKERAVLFMEEILEVGGYFNAVEPGFFLSGTGGGKKFPKGARTVQAAVAVRPVLPQHRVGGVAGGKLHRPALQNSLAQLRDRVGRPSGTVQKAEKKRQARSLAGGQKLGDVHRDRHPGVGVGHGAEVFKMLPAGVSLPVNDAVFHPVCSSLFDYYTMAPEKTQGRPFPMEKAPLRFSSYRTKSAPYPWLMCSIYIGSPNLI